MFCAYSPRQLKSDTISVYHRRLAAIIFLYAKVVFLLIMFFYLDDSPE